MEKKRFGDTKKKKERSAMERNERVLAYINSPEYIPLKISELMLVLDVPEEGRAELEAILEDWIQKGKIYRTKRGKYEAVKGQKIISGTLHCSARGYFGFVTPDDESEQELYIDGTKMTPALDGDRVLAMVDHTGDRSDGHIVRVLERKQQALSGVIKRKKAEYFEVRPDSGKIYATFRLPFTDALGAEQGERILFDITGYRDELFYITATHRLGAADSLKSNVNAILFSAGIKQEFDPETLAEAEAVPDTLSSEELAGRHDFRNETVITIDGDDARDFDDAVSVIRLKNGHYQLEVHIADVSHYVRPDSALDREAFLRGTSVYLPDRVIPMLPQKLSNGLCSLNPHCDRLTLSVTMEIDQNGGICSHALEKGVICSAERMTYQNVNKLLEGTDKTLSERYQKILPMLSDMRDLAQILNQKRQARGSIQFDFPESKVFTDDEGEPVEIRPVCRGISERIIEEFMLSANETIAEYAFWAEIPFIYRVHEPPSLEKIQDFQRFIGNFGLALKGKIDIDSPVHPKALQQVLDQIAGTEEEHMISTYLLRSLMKAEYKPENTGHFGLSAKYYCHFTSPIRRYPDLAIHRILKDFLDQKPLDSYRRFVQEAAVQSSKTELTAETCERDTDDLMKAYYMIQYIGYLFPGKISGITSFGIFVELENSVEGFIRLEYLKDDYYSYDEERRILIGEHTGKTYKIGDDLEIAVVRSNLLTRQIDFIPAEYATRAEIEKIRQKAFRQEREKEQKKNPRPKRKRRHRKRGKKHGSI